jgi:hypothetical protein
VQIVNPKGEMKGSAITGPVGKEAAELWPVSSAEVSIRNVANGRPAYRVQLWCRDVRCSFSSSSPTFMGYGNGEMHLWGEHLEVDIAKS